MNTRLMTIGEFDAELAEEANTLRRTIPQMKAELRDDPEGCFGGRGNNIGYNIVVGAENRLGWLLNRGYIDRDGMFEKLVEVGVNPTIIARIKFSEECRQGNNVLRIECEKGCGYACQKTLKSGATAEVAWIKVGDEWMGSEPPIKVLNEAEAIIQAISGAGLDEWREDFYCPRVYL